MNIIRRINKYLAADSWALGFIEAPLSEIVGNKSIEVHYLQHDYHDRWFADPWLLEVDDDTIKVLVEEYSYRERLGKISLLIIDRHDYRFRDRKNLLEIDSHLSFPAIWRAEDGKIYIYPENGEGGGLGLYEYSEDGLKYVHKLSTEPLADAVITDLFGERLMFSTHIPTHNGNVLSVHRIDMEKGNTELICEHVFTSNIARNAGDWFLLGGKVYRPAQDCNGGYGKVVVLQEVVRKEDGGFEFYDVRRLSSSHPRYNTGLHTFNHLNGLTVIDVHGYRFPHWVAKSSNAVMDACSWLRKCLVK